MTLAEIARLLDQTQKNGLVRQWARKGTRPRQPIQVDFHVTRRWYSAVPRSTLTRRSAEAKVGTG
jgi:hypothetical protein